MTISSAVKIWLMDVDSTVKRDRLLPVTSHNTFEPSSTRFHPEGLFSEQIFGQTGTPDRLIRFGYIDLNTQIVSPQIFKILTSLKGLYGDLMAGLVYARFDQDYQDFLACPKMHPEANTGYNFFLKHLPRLRFEKRNSVKRNDKIKVIERYADRLIINKFPVIPAGIRDIKEQNGRISSEEINKLYLAMLSLSQAIPATLGSTDSELLSIYDGVRYSLQCKAVQIYEYIQQMLDGKGGYLQKKYTSRALALGTRNIITAAKPEAMHPNSPTYQKHNETLVPLYQAAKMFHPAVVYQLRNMFYSQVFTRGSTKVVGIDPKTLASVYVEVTDEEINRAFSSEAYAALINSFENEHIRKNPVLIWSNEKKPYYLFLVYDLWDKIYILRNLDDFIQLMEKQGHEVDKDKIRPLSLVEMMYIATHQATLDKHCLITRYPVIVQGSVYPSKVQIGTTVPSRNVTLLSQYHEAFEVNLARYPILTNKYQDSTILHPCKMKGLDGDYDGDMVSVNGVLLDECNQEIAAYLQHPSSIATANGQLVASAETNVTRLVCFNFTRVVQPVPV